MPTEANIHGYYSKNPSSTLPSLHLSCFSESQKPNTFCILVAQYCYITQVHSSIFLLLFIIVWGVNKEIKTFLGHSHQPEYEHTTTRSQLTKAPPLKVLNILFI